MPENASCIVETDTEIPVVMQTVRKHYCESHIHVTKCLTYLFLKKRIRMEVVMKFPHILN